MANGLTNPSVSLRQLPDLLRKKLNPVTRDVIGEYGWEGSRLVGYEAAEMTEAERMAAFDWLEKALFPCPAQIAGKALSRLRAATKARREAAIDDAMLGDTFLDVLMEYPADAVVSACDEWRANNVFFPAEAELRKLLDEAVNERKLAWQAFRTRPRRPEAAPVPPVPERVTADQVDAILAKHGLNSFVEPVTVEVTGRGKPVVIGKDGKLTCGGYVNVKPGLSQAQLDAQGSENQAEYWLKMMGAG